MFAVLFILTAIVVSRCRFTEYRRVLLSSLDTIEFRADQRTESRIGKYYDQIIPSKDNEFIKLEPYVTEIVCRNSGYKRNGQLKWECSSETLPTGYKLKRASISCEGWDGPDDDYIVDGSCLVKYSIGKSNISNDRVVVPPKTTKTIYDTYDYNSGVVHTEEYEKSTRPRTFRERVSNFFTDGDKVKSYYRSIPYHLAEDNNIAEFLIVLLFIIVVTILVIMGSRGCCQKAPQQDVVIVNRQRPVRARRIGRVIIDDPIDVDYNLGPATRTKVYKVPIRGVNQGGVTIEKTVKESQDGSVRKEKTVIKNDTNKWVTYNRDTKNPISDDEDEDNSCTADVNVR